MHKTEMKLLEIGQMSVYLPIIAYMIVVFQHMSLVETASPLHVQIEQNTNRWRGSR